MTILAQAWLEERKPTKWDQWVRMRLAQPTTHADAVKQAALMADRLVMCEDPADLMFEMRANKQIALEDMYRHVRMPSECVWIEWNTKDNMQLGVLLDAGKGKHEPTGIAVAVLARSKMRNQASVAFAGSIPHLPAQNTSEGWCTLSWALGNETPAGSTIEKYEREYALSITTAVFVLFVMQHPRLTEKEHVAHSVAVQKKRAQHNKLPLLAYERIHIRINKDVPASVRRGMVSDPSRRLDVRPSDDTQPTHRRYHKVLGHFRTYHRGDAREYVTWIEPHWRGDPTLGVVLHEHRIEKGTVRTSP